MTDAEIEAAVEAAHVAGRRVAVHARAGVYQTRSPSRGRHHLSLRLRRRRSARYA